MTTCSVPSASWSWRLTLAGDTWGLGSLWARMPIVRKFPILR